MIENIILSIGIGLITYAIYKWIRLNDKYFEKQGIDFLKPIPIIGNTYGMFFRTMSMYDFISYIYNSSSEQILGFFDFRQPLYMVRDPEMVKQMAIKDFDHFEDHRSFIDEKVDRMFGNSLFMLKGQKWRDMRASLSPAFTGSKMRQMFELVTECAVDMSKYFVEKASSSGGQMQYEMKDVFQRFANDVIASTAFGIRVDSFKDRENEFLETGKTFLNLNKARLGFKVFCLRAMPKIMKFLDIEMTDKKVTNFFLSMVSNNIKTREEKNIFRPDMINILMQIKKGEIQNNDARVEEISSEGFATVEESSIGTMSVKRTWTDEELVAQCFLFFIAGFDTASTGLSFCSYELARNPDVQAKLYKEIIETNQKLNGKVLDYDTLQKMKYMDMVISESLRLWPPAPFTDRLCVKDYTYDDGKVKFTMKKGTSFWIPIYPFHHDPKYFSEPKKFDPERFSDENKDTINNAAYLPFGTGPRNCIGSRFALMELKAVIYYLLLNFEFGTCADTQIPLKLAKTPFGLQTEKGVHLNLKLRK